MTVVSENEATKTGAVEVADFTRVADRLRELGCPVPSTISILPENLESAMSRGALVMGANSKTIRTLLRDGAVNVDDVLPAGERAPTVHNKNFDWAALLFVPVVLWSNNPTAVSFALNIIANYATDFFRGIPFTKVKLSVVVEQKSGICKRLNYEGDATGLKALPEIIRALADE